MKSLIAIFILTFASAAHATVFNVSMTGNAEFGVVTPAEEFIIFKCGPVASITYDELRDAQIWTLIPGATMQIVSNGGTGVDINGRPYNAVPGDVFSISCW